MDNNNNGIFDSSDYFYLDSQIEISYVDKNGNHVRDLDEEYIISNTNKLGYDKGTDFIWRDVNNNGLLDTNDYFVKEPRYSLR